MFYIFHGDDEHTQRETLAELAGRLGEPDMVSLNTARFDGPSVSFADLRTACEALPFLAAKRLVIVTELFGRDPPFLDELLAYLPDLPDTARLVFLESRPLPASHPAVKLAEKSPRGYVKQFDRPQGGALERWIRERVEAAGGQIRPQAAHLLAANAGADLALLQNEIEKLVLYRAGAPITAEDVSLLCPYVAEASIFELVDALGNRNGPVAAELLARKLAEGQDPFALFAMVVRQFRLLLQARELHEAGRGPAEMAKSLKIHPFVAGKIAQQARGFSLEQVEQIYAHLLEMDLAAKSGGRDMPTSLALLAAGVAAEPN
ncbi:MAG: DNA polymerase III subunit delta [Candidatus Promineifilaceae bacterium]